MSTGPIAGSDAVTQVRQGPRATREVLVAYDGSPSATTAIEAGARLIPDARATIVHLWTPPFASAEVRGRLLKRVRTADEFAALIEQEGQAEAERLVQEGVATAQDGGWEAESRLQRVYGGEGFELARLATTLAPSVLLLGSRGLGGVRAVLGSVSDLAVHLSPVPALVVSHPLGAAERSALESGDVVVGHDGSEAARAASVVARDLFPGRAIVSASVGRPDVAGDGIVGVRPGPGFGARGIAEGLVRLAGERGAGLIVVGSRGRSAAKEILLGSVAMAVLHNTDRPVLVVSHGRSPGEPAGSG